MKHKVTHRESEALKVFYAFTDFLGVNDHLNGIEVLSTALEPDLPDRTVILYQHEERTRKKVAVCFAGGSALLKLTYSGVEADGQKWSFDFQILELLDEETCEDFLYFWPSDWQDRVGSGDAEMRKLEREDIRSWLNSMLYLQLIGRAD